MSALTANNDGRPSLPLAWIEVPVKASTHIYRGAFVCTNPANGYAVPGADTASFVYLGVAIEEVNNTGADGAMTVRVIPPANDPYQQAVAGNTADQTWLGSYVYLTDDQTCNIAANSTNKVAFGRVIKFVNATTVQVDTLSRFAKSTT